jgi:predicted phage terminase large subunit-like protein
MKRSAEYLQSRLQNCQRLFFQYNGREHARIEREMRANGFPDFNRRCLYARGINSGWIERYRWDRQLQWKRQAARVSSPHVSKGSLSAEMAIPVSTERGSDRGFMLRVTQHEKTQNSCLQATTTLTQSREPAGVASGIFVAPGEAKRNPGYGHQQDPCRRTSDKASSMAIPISTANNEPDVFTPTFSDDPTSRRRRRQIIAPGGAKRNPGYKHKQDSCRRTSDKASSMALPVLRKPARSKGMKPLNEFHAWIKKVSPPMFDWDAPHLRHVIEKLQLFTEGKIKRLMIFMPPRHGKSELVTTRYTAWRLMKDPTLKVILASYAQALANRFSRNIRNTLAEHFAIEKKSATNEHENTKKGLLKGVSTGSGSDRGSKSSPPYEGGVAPASGDGVVLSDDDEPLSSPFRSRIINSAQEWETGKGGGVKAVGVGGGITGYGAKLMMIDDPIKSREQAESQSYRDKVWHWFNDDMMTRLEPDAGVILIQTRWHEDDLAGRLLKQQQEEGTDEWHVINLPAICEEIKIKKGSSKESQFHFETPEEPKRKEPIWIWRDGRKEIIHSIGALRPEFQHEAPSPPKPAEDPADYDIIPDPLGRKIGEALWPARFPIESLEKTKKSMGTYSFAALYQQKPVPTEGGMFKRSWFSIVQAPPPNLNWKRGYDLSFTANPDSDPSATLKVAYDKDGTIYIDGCFRAKLTYPLQRKMLVHYIKSETRTEHGIELSANGHALLQDLRRMPELRGKKFRGIKVDSNKVTRALPWIALAEERRIRLVAGPWNEDFITEACGFPHGTNDDQIDAVSVAIAMHGNSSGKKFWSF